MTKEDAAIYAALADDELVAVTAYGEARNQKKEGILAVCAAIYNRHVLWHQRYREICLGRNQFECFETQAHVLLPIAKHWDSRITGDKALLLCYALARAVVEGTLPSNVGKCTFYKRFDCLSPWFNRQIAAGKMVEYGRILDHVFYLETRFATKQELAEITSRLIDGFNKKPAAKA